jgi:flavin-dependent dehydrogenase
MSDHKNAIIVGGGPAGLAAALALRARNFRVTVVDAARPPIEKVCGEGLLPETLEALRAIGVNTGTLPGIPFRGVRYIGHNNQVAAKLPGEYALGIRRSELQQSLLTAAMDAGTEFLWQTHVLGLDRDGVRVAGRKLRARWIIGADGQASRMRTWGGFENRSNSPQRFAFRRHYRVEPWTDFLEVYWSARGQAYVTIVGANEICVVIMSHDAKLRMSDLLRDFPELDRRLNGAAAIDKERGAVSRNTVLRNVTRGNVALVGDASGTVDAITGEGLGLAFRQVLALADALAAGDLDLYEAAHRRLRRKSQLMSSLLLAMSRSVFLQRRVIEVSAARPRLFERFLAAHAGKGSAAEVAQAGLRLGWNLLTV